MTSEEAILLLKRVEDGCDEYAGLNIYGKEAFNMAIEALETQGYASERYVDLCEYFDGCSDKGAAILHDRNEFKKWLERMRWIDKYGDWYTEEGTEEGYIGTIKGIVDSMPTIEPERKTGHWIDDGIDGCGALMIEYRNIKCDQCGWSSSLVIPRNFCPNCGADMRGEQE